MVLCKPLRNDVYHMKQESMVIPELSIVMCGMIHIGPMFYEANIHLFYTICYIMCTAYVKVSGMHAFVLILSKRAMKKLPKFSQKFCKLSH